MIQTKRYCIYIATIFAFLVLFPLWASDFLRDALILTLLYLASAEVWGFMAKHAGMVSLGQQIFIGIGGYATAVLVIYCGMPIWASVIIAGLLGSLLAAVLSFPLLRLRGVYFAIGSLLAAEVIKLLFNSWEFVGAGKGLTFRMAYHVPTVALCYSALILGASSIFLVYFLYHSKLGFGLRSIGEDEDAASSLGVDTFRCKALCFVLSSLITTFAGAINAIHHTYLHPTFSFGISWTVNFLFISVIGGIGTIIGPIVGSVIFVALGYLLSQYIGLSLLLEGIIVLAVLLVFPEGIWGAVSRRLKLKLKIPL